MSQKNWLESLQWGEDQLEDLRYAGYSYIRQGKYDIALQFFEALNVLNTDNAYDAQTLGAIYLQLNNPVKALKYLDKALKLEGEHSSTLINLAKTFFMLGKKDEALRICDILKDEKDPGISNLAKALLLAYS